MLQRKQTLFLIAAFITAIVLVALALCPACSQLSCSAATTACVAKTAVAGEATPEKTACCLSKDTAKAATQEAAIQKAAIQKEVAKVCCADGLCEKCAAKKSEACCTDGKCEKCLAKKESACCTDGTCEKCVAKKAIVPGKACLAGASACPIRTYAVPVLLGFSALLSLISIVSFKNRKRQLFLNRFNSCIVIATVGLMIFMAYTVGSCPFLALHFFPLIIVLFLILANCGIKCDTKRVACADRIR